MSESTLVKMPDCWKSLVAAQMYNTCVTECQHYKKQAQIFWDNVSWRPKKLSGHIDILCVKGTKMQPRQKTETPCKKQDTHVD